MGSQAAIDLLRFIDQCPSPWHAGEELAARCREAGATPLEDRGDWELVPGGFYVVQRGVSSVVAFRVGSQPGPLRVIGAHTDSPGFRVKPSGAQGRSGVDAVGVEIYGGPILATFADRDLSVAGRIVVDGDEGAEARLFRHDFPVLRLPNLAIHMNREVNSSGLVFDAHEQLPLLFRMSPAGDTAGSSGEPFREWLGESLGEPAEAIQAWELAAYDTQPGTLFGPSGEFYADGQIDNLASCHAGVEALLKADPASGVAMLAAFDHEEVGSESYKGAASSFLGDCLAGIERATAFTERELCARGWLLSADMAHGWNPAYANAYDERNAPGVNGGPAIKINARQRYATDAEGEAFFGAVCDRAGVPWQRYVHRGNLPCGSTIGPMASSRLGLRTVDVGNPMWAMHSARESAGSLDHDYIIRAFHEFYGEL